MNYCIMPEYVITGLQFLTFGLIANIIGWGALIWAIFRFRRMRDEWLDATDAPDEFITLPRMEME